MPTQTSPTKAARHELGPYHPCYRTALELYVAQYRRGASALPPGVRAVCVLAPAGFVELELAEGTESVEEALGTGTEPLEFSTEARAARGGRLPRLFRETWDRLPNHVRERVQAYLAARGRPLSVLLSALPPAHFPPAGRPLAQVSARHGELWFGTTALGLPEEAARTVAAHELAHVYIRALGVPATGPCWWNEWEEGRVDAFLEAWGFPMPGARKQTAKP